MRFRTGRGAAGRAQTALWNPSLRTVFGIVGLALTLALILAGCGGGDGGGSGSPTPTPGGATPTPSPTPTPTAGFRVRIDWGARSRVIGLSSAQSARVILEGANPAGGDLMFVVNRPASPATSVSETYDSPVPAKVGPWFMRVLFYGERDAHGDNVGFAGASANFLADGSLTATIATYHGISSVRILEGQSVAVGESRDIAFEARNPNGAVVAVTPGSVFFTIVSGADNVELVSGGSSVRGKRPTQATLTATIDGVTSAAVTIAVTSNLLLAVNPDRATIGSEFPVELTATVTNATDTDVSFVVEGGAANGSVQVEGNKAVFTAPKVTGNAARTVNVIVTSLFDASKRVVVPITVEPRVAVAIAPSDVTLSLERSQAFTATVSNLPPGLAAGDPQRGVIWSVAPDSSGGAVGTITADGVYTAPKRLGTFQVVATSRYDGTRQGAVHVTVVSRVAVDVQPRGVTLNWGEELDLTATVAETANQAVTWSIEPDAGGPVGTIAPTGASAARYTAPRRDGTFNLVATSVYDSSKTTVVPVIVVSRVAVDVSPGSADLSWGETLDLTAAVTNASDAGVVWSVESLSGSGDNATVTPTGAGMATFHAPKRDGVFKVVATSLFDNRKSASATITVLSRVAVAVAPPSADLNWAESVEFSAAVSRSPDTSVTWSVESTSGSGDDGTLTVLSGSRVRYTAPKRDGTFVITARSNYDPTRTAIATVTVLSKVVVSVEPNAAALSWGESANFAVTVLNAPDSTVTTEIRSLSGSGDNGTLVALPNNQFRYFAPKRDGTLELVFTSAFDPNRKAIATVTVQSAVAVSVSPPGPVGLVINNSTNFQAAVDRIPAGQDGGVAWTVEAGPGGGPLGTVTPGANNTVVFKAPGQKGGGVNFLVATSNYDPSKQARVRINLQAGGLDLTVK